MVLRRIYGFDFCILNATRSQYLPAATKLGQGNIFTSVCQEFCPQGGRVSASVHAGIHSPGANTPQEQTPPPLGADTPPRSRPPRADTHPRSRHPPGSRPPQSRHTAPSPWEADCSIRSTSGRYASYWNAFLFRNEIVPFSGSLSVV